MRASQAEGLQDLAPTKVIQTEKLTLNEIGPLAEDSSCGEPPQAPKNDALQVPLLVGVVSLLIGMRYKIALPLLPGNS
jgi:hypothetical protein